MAEQGQGIPVNITAPEFMQYMMQSQATANNLITQLQAQNVQLAEQNANLSARLQDLEARFVEGGKGLGKSKGYPLVVQAEPPVATTVSLMRWRRFSPRLPFPAN